MTRQVSDRLSATFRFPNHAQLHLKIRTSRWRRKMRGFLRSLIPAQVGSGGDIYPGVTPRFEAASNRFRANHWAYVEDFWDADFHARLIEEWPPDRYFEPIKYVTKSYDTGFVWSHSAEDPPYLYEFPGYKAAYDFLRSGEFCRRVDEVVGDGVERRCYQLIMTRSYWGSSIIPHLDSANVQHSINIVIFINGSGGPRGGGLGIWADNEFQKPIFIPENLRNSCIFYDMHEGFYHGFRPMGFGSFRWSLNAAYKKR